MMTKQAIRFTDYYFETLGRMREDGLLLVSADRDGKPNVMTIGWGSIGIMWGRPVFTVMVRPTRFTYKLLEEVPEFTVNVPPAELAEAAKHCGTVSGATHDKFLEMNLDAVQSREVAPPIIGQCVIHYECRIVHRCDMRPDLVIPEVRDECYPGGNFHRYYFGELVACYANEDAGARLVGSAG